MGHTAQIHFQGDRDLLFNLFGRVTRPLGNDLRVSVRDVGIRLDGKIVKGNNAPEEEDKRRAQHEHSVAQGEVNQVTDHLPWLAMAVENSSAAAITWSPGFNPP